MEAIAFQLTTSHRGRHFPHPFPFQYLSFQLTTSHRGRRCDQHHGFQMEENFNSLPHTEVDVREDELTPDYLIFQLTTSHRGRRCPHSRQCFCWYFNSLPHTEVDALTRSQEANDGISTHYLTQR